MLELLPVPLKGDIPRKLSHHSVQHVSVPQWINLAALLHLKEAKCLHFTVNM